MRWLSIALAACRFAAVAEHAPCPAPQVWPSQLDDVAFDDTRPRLRKRGSRECGGDAGARDWCRETVFPELYFGGLVEALEEHMANGDLVFPEGK